VISRQAKDRICKLVQSGIDTGARIVLDGREIVVPHFEDGNFIGPTVLADVKSDMDCYKVFLRMCSTVFDFACILLILIYQRMIKSRVGIIHRIRYSVSCTK
jgi:hypothetical protein